MANLVVNGGALNTAALNGSDATILDQTWDVGIGADSSAVIEFADTSDIGFAVETVGAALFYITSSDIGTGSDATGAPQSATDSTDRAIGSDAETSWTHHSYTASDTGVGFDSAGGFYRLSTSSDLGNGVETTATDGYRVTTDLATGSDAGSTLAYSVAADSAIGTDAATGYLVLYSATTDTGIGTESVEMLVVAELAAYVVHSDTGAVSSYAMPSAIRGMAAADGLLYVATADGLYAMDAATDDGTAIQWGIKTGLMDFGTEFIKRVHDVDILARASGDVVLSVITIRNGLKRRDSYRKPVVTATAHRDGVTKIGLDLTSVYWGIELEGLGSAEVDALVVSPLSLSRRR